MQLNLFAKYLYSLSLVYSQLKFSGFFVFFPLLFGFCISISDSITIGETFKVKWSDIQHWAFLLFLASFLTHSYFCLGVI